MKCQQSLFVQSTGQAYHVSKQKNQDPGAVSRKPRKLFGPTKSILIICLLKKKWYIDMKLHDGNVCSYKNYVKRSSAKLGRANEPREPCALVPRGSPLAKWRPAPTFSDRGNSTDIKSARSLLRAKKTPAWLHSSQHAVTRLWTTVSQRKFFGVTVHIVDSPYPFCSFFQSLLCSRF